MVWKNVDFDWNHAKAFLVTARMGSFTAAAKSLNTTQSTLSRNINSLEQSLGVLLFERVGRGIEITQAGLELLQHVEVMSDAAVQFSMTASGKVKSLQGRVTISASEVFSSHLLPDLLIKLRKQEPGLEIEILSTNQASDLRRREADIAIRNFKPVTPELIARQLPDTKASLYASHEYLARQKQDLSILDMKTLEFISFGDNETYIKELNNIGITVEPENFPYISESHLIHWALVKSGAGIGVMPNVIADHEPSITPISSGLASFSIESWLVSHRELLTSPRIRLVYDFLYKEISHIFDTHKKVQ